jgi:hypothetical protein
MLQQSGLPDAGVAEHEGDRLIARGGGIQAMFDLVNLLPPAANGRVVPAGTHP